MVVVLSIDRDNDIGEKTGIAGPVIGKKNNLKAAQELILADPEDSDANTIFAAVKLAKELGAEVVTITGHRKVGVQSDRIISMQLEKVARKIKDKKAILVTDGVEDEFVLPLIQNKFEIVSVKRIIVKQSQQLEGMYYMISSFIKDTLRDKETARMVLGIPAVALLLLAIFGTTGWRVILLGLGLFLFVKGFGIEHIVSSTFGEFRSSLHKNKVTFFLYIVGVIFFSIGVAYGYSYTKLIGYSSWIQIGASFLSRSIYYFFIAAAFLWVGKIIRVFTNKRKVMRFTTIFILFSALAIVAKAASQVLLRPELGFSRLIYSITLGVAMVVTSVIVQHINRRNKKNI
ncbi:MAG TPA: DUF373 family protein [Candidatus Atribacteria bacterium]|nr:DUF373 family protein [Candidatus Atribacteria bacterium]